MVSIGVYFFVPMATSGKPFHFLLTRRIWNPIIYLSQAIQLRNGMSRGLQENILFELEFRLLQGLAGRHNRMSCWRKFTISNSFANMRTLVTAAG